MGHDEGTEDGDGRGWNADRIGIFTLFIRQFKRKASKCVFKMKKSHFLGVFVKKSDFFSFFKKNDFLEQVCNMRKGDRYYF
jgi:hypothetical protein